MYTPGSEGVILARVGTSFELLSTFTDYSVTHEYSAPATADRPLDKTVPAQAAGSGSVAPGQMTCTLAPPDISGPAFKAYREAALSNSEIEMQSWFGTYKEVGDQATGTNTTTVAISNAGILTLAQKGTGSDAIPATFGSSDLQPGDFWDRGQHIVIAGVAYHLGPWQSATTRKVTRVGAVASDIVTPDDTALAAVPATDTFTVVEYIMRHTLRGRPTTALDTSAAAAGLSISLGLDLGSYETLDYAHKEY